MPVADAFFQVPEGEVLYCHWKRRPFPIAETVNFAVFPAGTVLLTGWVLMAKTCKVTVLL